MSEPTSPAGATPAAGGATPPPTPQAASAPAPTPQARAWLNQQAKEHGLRQLAVEAFLINETLGYGGTLDLIAELDGENGSLSHGGRSCRSG